MVPYTDLEATDKKEDASLRHHVLDSAEKDSELPSEPTTAMLIARDSAM